MMSMPGRSFRGPLPPLSAEERELAEAIRADLTRLAVDIGERNVFHGESLHEAACFIEESFASAGYAARSEEYTVAGKVCRNIEAARTLLWKAAWSWDTGEDQDPMMVHLTKAFVNEAVLKIVENAMEAYAGYGAQKEFPVEKHLRNAYTALHGGSTPTVNRLKAMRLLLKSVLPET